MMLAETLQIDAERALEPYYSTEISFQLAPKYELQLMSDQYIVDNILEELRQTTY